MRPARSLVLLRFTPPLITLLHFLIAIVCPGLIDTGYFSRWLLSLLRVRIPFCRSSMTGIGPCNWAPASSTHEYSVDASASAPALPAAPPPAAQASQVLVQQAVIVTPKVADRRHKRWIGLESLLIGLTSGLA